MASDPHACHSRVERKLFLHYNPPHPRLTAQVPRKTLMTRCMIRAALSLFACFELLVFIGGARQVNAAEKEDLTPLLLSVADAPAPFTGSNGRTHLAYELWITNFSS